MAASWTAKLPFPAALVGVDRQALIDTESDNKKDVQCDLATICNRSLKRKNRPVIFPRRL